MNHLYESPESNQRCERAPHICKQSNIIKYHSLCYKGLSLSMKWHNMPMSRSSWKPIPFLISLSISSAPHTDPLQWSTAWPVCAEAAGMEVKHMSHALQTKAVPKSWQLLAECSEKRWKPQETGLIFNMMNHEMPSCFGNWNQPWDNASHHIFSASPVTVPCQLPQPALLGTTCARDA